MAISDYCKLFYVCPWLLRKQLHWAHCGQMFSPHMAVTEFFPIGRQMWKYTTSSWKAFRVPYQYADMADVNGGKKLLQWPEAYLNQYHGKIIIKNDHTNHSVLFSLLSSSFFNCHKLCLFPKWGEKSLQVRMVDQQEMAQSEAKPKAECVCALHAWQHRRVVMAVCMCTMWVHTIIAMVWKIWAVYHCQQQHGRP